MKRKLQ